MDPSQDQKMGFNGRDIPNWPNSLDQKKGEGTSGPVPDGSSHGVWASCPLEQPARRNRWRKQVRLSIRPYLGNLPLIPLISSGDVVCQWLRTSEVMIAAWGSDDIALARDLSSESRHGPSDYAVRAGVSMTQW